MSEIDTSTAAIAALMDGVTEGPWAREAQGIYANGGNNLVAHMKPHEWVQSWPQLERNGNFIAASRSLVPALIAERDAAILRAEQAEARAAELEADVEQLRDRVQTLGTEGHAYHAGRISAAEIWHAERDAMKAEIEKLRCENARLRAERDYDRSQSSHKLAVIDRLNARVEAAEAIKAEFAAVIRRLGGVPFMRSIVGAQRNANGAYILYADGSALIKVNSGANASPVKIPYDAAALDRPTAQARAQGMREAAVIAAHRYAVCEDAFSKGLGAEERHCALEAKHIEDKILARAEEIEKGARNG